MTERAIEIFEENCLNYFTLEDLEGMTDDTLDELGSLLGKGWVEEEDVYLYYTEVNEDLSPFEDDFRGEFNDLAEFAKSYVDDTGEIPDFLVNYIDYEKMGEDWSNDYTVVEKTGGTIILFYL